MRNCDNGLAPVEKIIVTSITSAGRKAEPLQRIVSPLSITMLLPVMWRPS